MQDTPPPRTGSWIPSHPLRLGPKKSFLQNSTEPSKARVPDLSGKRIYHEGPSLYDSGNILSYIFFLRAASLAWLGSKQTLQHSNLFKLGVRDSFDYNWKLFWTEWKKEIAKAKRKNRGLSDDDKNKSRPSLIWATWRAFGPQAFLCWVLACLSGACTFVAPVMLPYIISYFNDPKIPIWYGFVYAVAILCSLFLSTMVNFHASWMALRLGLSMRSAFVGVVYRKALRMAQTSDRTTGRVVNLMSTDTMMFADTLYSTIVGLTSPVQIALAVGLLSIELGVYCLVPLACILLLLPFNLWLGTRIGASRKAAQHATDLRIRMVRELVQAIRVIKYYVWETPFAEGIQHHRDQELQHMSSMRAKRSWVVVSWLSLPSIGTAVTFLIYSIKNTLNTTKIFTSFTYLNLLRAPFLQMPLSLIQIPQYKVSLRRIEDFALRKENPPRNIDYDPKLPKTLIMNKASFAWDNLSDSATVLNEVSVHLPKNSLTMVIGPVGSGKSNLAQAFLGELIRTSGTCQVNGSVAYVSQENWVLNGTIRSNILFGSEYDEKRYLEVLEAAHLIADIRALPGQDNAPVGDRGSNLSGGQRQRICIARALYADRDIYILDDPFSAVDPSVARGLMQNAVVRYLKQQRGKTILLISNQLQFSPLVDHILVMDNGEVAEQGNFKQLMAAKHLFASLIEEMGIMDENDANDSVMMARFAKQAYLTRSRSQRTTSNSKLTADQTEEGRVSSSIYFYYLTRSKTFWFILLIFLRALSSAVRVGQTVWLAKYSGGELTTAKNSLYTPVFIMGIYLVFAVGEALINGLASIVFVLMAKKASRAIHAELVDRLLHAPVEFYDRVPSGRIMARFSKDVSVIDWMLPQQIDSSIFNAFSVLAVCAALGVGSRYILIAAGPIIIAFVLFQIWQLKATIGCQRIEASSRAPIYSHLAESLEGSTTIRAFNKVSDFERSNANHIDHNTVDFLSLRYIMCWVGMCMEWGAQFLIAATYFAILGLRNTSGIDVPLASLAMSQSSGLTSALATFTSTATEVEMRMNSVERVRQYLRIPQEAPFVNFATAPPPEWPQEGAIQFNNLTVSYGLVPALSDITCSILPGEKIGIVGRTGAGKSTFVSALFRVTEPTSGNIVIDGIDIGTLGLQDLRSKLSIIPQTPQLFIGDIRYNLDPFGERTDEEIWEVLKQVELEKYISSLPRKLYSHVEENGANFSVGQRHLLAMGRALLKPTQILLLDEATSGVDARTDSVIQRALRLHFAEKTVLTIAHRLNTVIDSDRILVLDHGRIAEFDTPHRLLSDQKSIFSRMVASTGNSSEAYLRKVAEEKDVRRQRGFSSKLIETEPENGLPEDVEIENQDLGTSMYPYNPLGMSIPEDDISYELYSEPGSYDPYGLGDDVEYMDTYNPMYEYDSESEDYVPEIM